MSFAFNRGVGSNFSTKIWKEIFHGNSCWQEVLKVLQDCLKDCDEAKIDNDVGDTPARDEDPSVVEDAWLEHYNGRNIDSFWEIFR